MTVFKTYWKIVKKYKGTIILYTVMLIIFGGLNLKAENNPISFSNTKPDIYIKNLDKEGKLASNLVNYLKENNNIIQLEDQEEKIKDALFYREVNYTIEIPKNYTKNIMNGENPEIKIKSTKDYQASLVDMMLKNYLKLQAIYQKPAKTEEELIKEINDTLSKKSDIKLTSKLNTDKLEKISQYFSFASYTIMATIIFVICLVLSSFKEQTVNKRTLVSSTNYKKYNQSLLLASFAYTTIVWLLFSLLGLIIFKDSLLNMRGLIYSLNTFVFTFCSLTIALTISTLVKDKNAVSGIVNVVALGSAFLCGAFVPAEYLPKSVIHLAHLLPSYYYISSNDILKQIETISLETLQPIFLNILALFIFSLIFIIINNIISKSKRKIG